MKRSLRGILGLAVVAAAFAVVPVSPASAHTDVCVGTGTATTAPLYYPGTHPGGTTASTTGGFALTMPGACVLTGTLSAGGQLTGWCGHSSSDDLTVDGHASAYVSAGSMIVVTGDVGVSVTVGAANAVPEVGTSCLNGATSFTVTGAVLLVTP